jgi:probable H4MPT-linked C1 transfer pathway protein
MSDIVLGLDIGGANLKAASSDGEAVLYPFELWRQLEDLPAALTKLIAKFEKPQALALTMTGELCDCFATRREGVHCILAAVQHAASGVPVHVWNLSGDFQSISNTGADPLNCAASNWLALATYAGRFVPSGLSVLIDIGSTTTDIVPFIDGRPVPKAFTDRDRLRVGELVYTGVRRTPVCALLGGNGAAEFFATTQDVYIVLGRQPEEPENRQTANGQPASIVECRSRLARMLCADLETCSQEEIERLAQEIWQRQMTLVRAAFDRVWASLSTMPAESVPLDGGSAMLPASESGRHAQRYSEGRADPRDTPTPIGVHLGVPPGAELESMPKSGGRPPTDIVIGGTGEFLARDVLRSSAFRLISLADRRDSKVSAAACAYALAILARERLFA